MKLLRLFLALNLACFAIGYVGAVSGCATAPSARVVQVQTLKAVGQSAEAAVNLSAQLYADGKITPLQARAVIDFYDTRFQPAYRVAVAAVRADLNSLASPDLVTLAAQLATMVAQLTAK